MNSFGSTDFSTPEPATFEPPAPEPTSFETLSFDAPSASDGLSSASTLSSPLEMPGAADGFNPSPTTPSPFEGIGAADGFGSSTLVANSFDPSSTSDLGTFEFQSVDDLATEAEASGISVDFYDPSSLIGGSSETPYTPVTGELPGSDWVPASTGDLLPHNLDVDFSLSEPAGDVPASGDFLTVAGNTAAFIGSVADSPCETLGGNISLSKNRFSFL